MVNSPVDDESLASDPTGSIAEKKDGGVGDVLNVAWTSKGDGGSGCSFSAGNAEAGHTLSIGDGSRSDNVRPNPPRTLLNGNHTREGINASFGRGNVGLVRRSYQSV